MCAQILEANLDLTPSEIKRILIDDTTRMALTSEKPATLATYRMELGDKFIPVKNVFVPLWVKGRRWGNFELAYRDD